MKITTKSGFKCEVKENVVKDWRYVKALAKCQNDETALEGGVELVDVLLGAKGQKDLEKHLEALDGYVDAEKIFSEVTEIINVLGAEEKN